MMNLSGDEMKISEQHVNLGPSIRKRDHEDYKKFKAWFIQRNPFTFQDEHLHSLSSGWVSNGKNDNVNCDRAEEIGLAIQKSLDDQNFGTAVIRRKNCLKPLEALQRVQCESNKKRSISIQLSFLLAWRQLLNKRMMSRGIYIIYYPFLHPHCSEMGL